MAALTIPVVTVAWRWRIQRTMVSSLMFALAVSAATLHGQVITAIAGTDWRFPPSVTQALSAPLGLIQDIAVDAQGNVYMADWGNNVVLKISPGGMLTVAAGHISRRDSTAPRSFQTDRLLSPPI